MSVGGPFQLHGLSGIVDCYISCCVFLQSRYHYMQMETVFSVVYCVCSVALVLNT